MKEKGQTLIEAVVALGVIVVILSAIAVAVLSSLNNAQYSKNQNLATQYAQQGMEVVRQISQGNWSSFSSLANGQYCLDAGQATLTSSDIRYPPPPPGCAKTAVGPGINVPPSFAREVDIEQTSGSCSGGTLVTIKVSWSDGGCTSAGNLYCRNVQLVSCMTNAR